MRRFTLYLFVSHSTVKSGSLLIDSSTIDPAVSKEVDIIAQTKGATFMDAPVSGGQSMCNISSKVSKMCR